MWFFNEIIDSIKEIKPKLPDQNQNEREFYSIRDIVQMIEEAYREDDHVSILIIGQRGAGKTTLMLNILANVYRFKGRASYMRALNYVFFKPQEAIEFVYHRLLKARPIKAIGLDDAGSWISKWLISSEKAGFLEFTNLFREALASVIYTDIASINKYIRDTVNIIIYVSRISDKFKNFIIDQLKEHYPEYEDKIEKLRKYKWAEAKIYKSHFDVLFRTWIKKDSVLYYPLKIPDPARKKYKKIRRERTIELAERVLEKIMMKHKIDELKLKRLELELEELKGKIRELEEQKINQEA